MAVGIKDVPSISPARRSTQQALRRLQSQSHTASTGLSARLEVLIAEKSAAYQARNMERYEAAIETIQRVAVKLDRYTKSN